VTEGNTKDIKLSSTGSAQERKKREKKDLFACELKELALRRVESSKRRVLEIGLCGPDVTLLDNAERRCVRPRLDKVRRQLVLDRIALARPDITAIEQTTNRDLAQTMAKPAEERDNLARDVYDTAHLAE
jgi:hypothetical protein